MKTLLQKYLNSVAVFDKENEQGRPDIKVESVDNRKDKDKGDPWQPQDDKDTVDNREEKEEKEEEEEEKDDDKEEEKELTAEEKAEAKEQRRQDRIQKRIDKLTASNANKDNEINELKRQLAEKPKEGLSEEEVERRAEEKAKKLSDAREADRQQKEFANTAETLMKGAKKLDKDFEKKINEVAEDTDIKMPMYMVELLAEHGEIGSEILVQLSLDPDLYEEVCVLKERGMVRRLDKMADEIKAKKKGKKSANERPDPPEPLDVVDGTNNRGNNMPTNPTKNMEEFVRIRALQTEARRKARGY